MPMPGETPEFNMEAAVSDLSSELGFGEETATEGADDVNLEITAPADTASQQKEGEQAEKTAEDPEDPATVATATDVKAAPRTWRAEAAAEFAKLSPVVQDEILKREEDIFRGIEQYREAATFGNEIRQVMAPYMQTLQQYNIQPAAQVADMMQAHYTMAFGNPEQKLELFRQVAQDYGVDLTQLILSTPYQDPQVTDLQKQLRTLQSQLTTTQTQQREAMQKQVTQHVQAFATDPKNIYFEELANDIAHLIATGACNGVEDAYEKAMWSNPSVRAKELARQQQEQQTKGRAEAERKAAEAKKATSVNVRPKAKSGSATAPLGSMDDTLAETLAAITSRG